MVKHKVHTPAVMSTPAGRMYQRGMCLGKGKLEGPERDHRTHKVGS